MCKLISVLSHVNASLMNSLSLANYKLLNHRFDIEESTGIRKRIKLFPFQKLRRFSAIHSTILNEHFDALTQIITIISRILTRSNTNNR